MTASLALMTLLLAQPQTGAAAAAASTQQAPLPPCETFGRSSPTAPPLVRGWFAGSGDERVLVCPQPAAPDNTPVPPLYVGEGAVTRHGAVCSYASHGLTVIGSGAAARLRRYERTEASAMALASSDCPVPHAAALNAYILTYEVGPGAFVSIMQLWSAVAASGAAFDREIACCDLGGGRPGASGAAAAAPTSATATANVRRRLRAAIEARRMQKAVVTRIVSIPGSLLSHRYALFVQDPQSAPGEEGLYVLYLRRGLRGPSYIIGIAESN